MAVTYMTLSVSALLRCCAEGAPQKVNSAWELPMTLPCTVYSMFIKHILSMLIVVQQWQKKQQQQLHQQNQQQQQQLQKQQQQQL